MTRCRRSSPGRADLLGPAAGHPVRARLGPADGPLVVALHGFPDTAWTWRHLGPHLAGLGWRVVAPHLRGYAPSGLPRDGSVHVGAVMADAVAIHERLGGDDRAVLVGHDWGAIAVNALNGHDDSPFARAVTLAVPPMQAMAGFDAALMLRQARNSWYILFNQLPYLPERTHERLIRRLWRDWSPGYDAREDLRHVLAAVADPGAPVGAVRLLPGAHQAVDRARGLPPLAGDPRRDADPPAALPARGGRRLPATSGTPRRRRPTCRISPRSSSSPRPATSSSSSSPRPSTG